jgi:hypothetical protein
LLICRISELMPKAASPPHFNDFSPQLVGRGARGRIFDSRMMVTPVGASPLPRPISLLRRAANSRAGRTVLRSGEQVLIALKAHQITGLNVSVDPQSVVALEGMLPDGAAMNSAVNAIRQVRGVRGVSYNVLVRGSSSRVRPGPPVPPDVLEARVAHALNRYSLPALRVNVDPGRRTLPTPRAWRVRPLARD